jgi:hypothetical protein
MCYLPYNSPLSMSYCSEDVGNFSMLLSALVSDNATVVALPELISAQLPKVSRCPGSP